MAQIAVLEGYKMPKKAKKHHKKHRGSKAAGKRLGAIAKKCWAKARAHGGGKKTAYACMRAAHKK